MATVGELRVNLKAGTAEFTGPLSDARASLGDFGTAAREAGQKAEFSMREARGSMMLMEHELGVRLPREMNTLIAGIPGIGVAMEALLPILGVVFAVKFITDWVEAHRKATEEMAAAHARFGTVAQEVFNGLDDRLLQAGKKADELRGDHLAALNKELTLIDHATLKDLAKEFEALGKSADAVFDGLKAKWYEIGSGSAGAKNALTEFGAQYEQLLALGKGGEANDLLKGTLTSAEKTLATMRAAKAEASGDTMEEQGGGPSEKELSSQEALVATLQRMVTVKGKLAELNAKERGNDLTEAAQKAAREQTTAAEKMFEDIQRKREEYTNAVLAMNEK